MSKKSINIYGNRHPKRGALVANPIPFENKFWYDIFQPIVDAINKLYTGASNVFKSSETIWLGVDNSINVNKDIFNKIGGYSVFGGQNIPFATINGQQIIGNNSNIIVESGQEYTAGENISINNGVISAVDTKYTAGQNIIITGTTISAIQTPSFAVLIVDTLPESGNNNTIYFISNSTNANQNVYDEYMYINNNWEKIGSTTIDLSNYYNKTETDNLLSNKQNKLTTGSNITINGNTISATDTTYSNATKLNSGLMSSEDKTNLDNALWTIRKLSKPKYNEIKYITSDNNYIYPYADSSDISMYLPIVLDQHYEDGFGILECEHDIINTGYEAFYNIQELTYVELPEEIRIIGIHSFANTSLTEITIPKSVIEIQNEAFLDCANLYIVKYNGTMDDWNAMTIGNDVFNGTNVTEIICINGIVSI